MSQDSFTIDNDFAVDNNQNIPAPPRKPNALGSIIICCVFLTLGTGGGLATMYALPGNQQANTNTANRCKQRLEFMQWLVGDDTSKKSRKTKSRKKKRHGPFDSVFGSQEAPEPYQPPNFKSPWEPEPVISF